ncbi:LLM class flavin-dependent oxidoreductase [Streptomyces sp. NPDC002738]
MLPVSPVLIQVGPPQGGGFRTARRTAATASCDWLRAPSAVRIFPAEARRIPALLEITKVTDTEGLGPLGVQGRPDQAKFRDAWALMATALARTERVRMCPDVSSLPLRPPAVMAKMAASLDVMSGGRFELAVRAGLPPPTRKPPGSRTPTSRRSK